MKWLSENLNNYKLENIAQVFDTLALMQTYKNKNIDNIKINDIKHFLEQANKLEDYPINLLNSLDQNVTALMFKVNNKHNLKLIKAQFLVNDFSQELKDLVEITYFECVLKA
ncbi:MAG: hypothetical protein O7C59_03595 [Rickettsia endosymbiont of Ixodes persulcatus]|nr:hypothetical protein [Rickettsia endosymbiont of Ixodes persulcatus]MCZ6901320.1 hypothetical protein [Rickettsia endosymbiont of Ixodes persulcatus]MCZ6903148.1 hypothetical protein [Rickettsia endosymbiont of Ixodes persulcatus]MCZ6908985.1 hypothetical protein [Rickettsia endosymbiont of Ixodes persulcatus]MCZ6910949.1 hypothetical protein [Rickettsia endosymbiont of Ixodes persulcatus]